VNDALARQRWQGVVHWAEIEDVGSN